MVRRKVMFDTLEGSLKTNVPADAAQAHKDLEARKTTGSIILTP